MSLSKITRSLFTFSANSLKLFHRDPNKSEKKKHQKSGSINACIKVKASPLCGPLTALSTVAWNSFPCNHAVHSCLCIDGNKSTSLGVSSSTSLNISSVVLFWWLESQTTHLWNFILSPWSPTSRPWVSLPKFNTNNPAISSLTGTHGDVDNLGLLWLLVCTYQGKCSLSPKAFQKDVGLLCETKYNYIYPVVIQVWS